MKKFYFFLINSILISLLINAQSPSWEWVRQGGSTGNESSGRCARDIYNNIYVTGQFQGVATFGSIIMTSNGGDDGFIAKYDFSGVLLWVKQIGGSGSDGCYNITIDSAGTNFYVTGWYNGTVLFDTTSVPSHGGQDAFIAKYDSSGILQWVEHGGSTGDASRGMGITIDKSHQYIYATGFCGLNSDFDTTSLSNPYCDIFLVKYEVSNGTLIWAKHAGGLSDDWGEGVTTDHLGNVYLTGWVRSNATFDAFPIYNTGGNRSNFLAKYDSSGSVIWVTASSGVGQGGTGLVIDSSESKIYVLAEINGTTYYDTDTIASYGSSDITLALYDSSGGYHWVKHFGGTGTEWSAEITLDKWSNIYISGTFSNTASFIDSSVSSFGSTDAFFAKLDSSGTLLWIETAGGSGDDHGIGLSINNNGSIIYLSGNFTGSATFGSFAQNAYGSKDIFVGKLNQVSAGVINLQDGTDFTLYPNPSNGSFSFFVRNKIQSGTIDIFNSIGQKVYSEQISNSVKEKEINLEAAAGIYFIRFSEGEMVLTHKLLIE
jgi:hypothetical protein